jgi:1,4-dihydroxy-6-naphthoate synthase
VTALSLAAYPFVQEDYALLPHGASIGSGYGPIVVSRTPDSLSDLDGREIVVPGALTTAFLTLRLVLGPDLRFRELPFEQIPEEVASGRADYGLLIHEGQLTFSDHGLHKVLDLGEWWLLETGLPLPLGVNVVRRDVQRIGDLSEVLAEAIRCGLEHRDEALEYALQFGRGIDEAVADRFIEMYVNELTEDYGDEGRSAVAELLRRGEAIGAFPQPVVLDFV